MTALSHAQRLALLPELRRLALEAGAEIMRHYDTNIAVERKEDRSPVTAADRAAEALILPDLRKLIPGVPIVAEEEASAGRVPKVGSGSFWLVDPLGGIKEFLAHNGEFTVNIGLIEDGLPTLGVVHAPALPVTYLGAVPGHATVERPGAAPQPIRARPAPAEGLTVCISRSHAKKDEVDDFLAGYRVHDLAIAGSSIKFCRVAEGMADLYPRLGPTMEWDTAAGHAVLAAAGGTVLRLDGTPLRYAKPDFRNVPFLAAGA